MNTNNPNAFNKQIISLFGRLKYNINLIRVQLGYSKGQICQHDQWFTFVNWKFNIGKGRKRIGISKKINNDNNK